MEGGKGKREEVQRATENKRKGGRVKGRERRERRERRETELPQSTHRQTHKRKVTRI